MAKKQKKVSKGAPKWMATFSDLMTLVLVFFVLLFAMSEMDAVKFMKLKESFDNAAVTEGLINLGEDKIISLTTKTIDGDEIQEVVKKRQSNTEELDDLFEKIKKYIEEKGMDKQVSATREEDGVKIVVLDNVLFDGGEAELKPSAKKIISELSDFFLTVNNDIEVEGHTDNRPISNIQYASNWELSSARAGSIIRYLVSNKELNAERFKSIGYADTKPVAPNDGEVNWQKNRRVIIFIKEN